MIYGQSGGGSKVTCLMGMPSASGLFHRASVQSGGGGNLPGADQAHRFPLYELMRQVVFNPANSAEAWVTMGGILLGAVGQRLGGLMDDVHPRIVAARRAWMSGTAS